MRRYSATKRTARRRQWFLNQAERLPPAIPQHDLSTMLVKPHIDLQPVEETFR